MFRITSLGRVLAAAGGLMLAASPAYAEDFNSSDYNVPVAVEILVSADLSKIARSDDTVKQLFVAYAVGFTMTLTSEWSEGWPADIGNLTMKKMTALAVFGPKEGSAVMLKGTRDAKIFMSRHTRQSAAARRLVIVLQTLSKA